MEIQVYRDSTEVSQLPLDLSVFTKALMGVHQLVFNMQSPKVIDVQVGDTITYKGEVMTINRTPEMTRSHFLEYSIIFEGVRHSLARFLIKDEGALTFDYTASLDDFMFMFLESINDVDSGWTLGDIEETDVFSVSFDKVDHLSALNMIAEACECEWQLIGKQITVKKTVGQARAYPLSYGKENGLYSIRRVSLENANIVTRAYAVGGTQNLPQGYPYRQLTLDGYEQDATAVGLYGIREGVIEDLSIFPHRTGSATAVGQINEATFTLSDSTIDFDLNGQFIDGTTPKIVFKSGLLNGQEFTILAYNHVSKTIRYEANEDSNGGLLPSGALLADVGDEYTIVGIRMPSSYVTAALLELTAKRTEYLNSNKVPRVVYEAPLDPLDLKRNGVVIEEGDILPFTDDKIGLNDNLRVTSVSYPGTFPDLLTQGMVFNAEIGQEVTYTRIQKIEKDIKDNKDVITQETRTRWENDRRNAVALREFMGKVFDPDGNMQEPLVQAIAAVFGTTSMYYNLEDVQITVNPGGDENALELTSGKLIHSVYEISGLGYIWDLAAFSEDGLDPIKPYYLAAKCSRTALTGEWVLTEDQYMTDEDPGYWYFNLGILSSVIEGERSFRPTKMFTVISGGNIETDTITAYMIDVQRLFAQLITVGSGGYENAGISGLADNGDESVRFWAGSDAAGRDTAPFRVLDDGTVITTKGLIGGFEIEGNELTATDNDQASIVFESLSGFIRLISNTNQPLIDLRTDLANRMGVRIQNYGNDSTSLDIINNGGGNSKAINSYGGHIFGQRSGETWNAPGMLAAAIIRPSDAHKYQFWTISGLGTSVTKQSSNVIRWTHNLGHEDYVVIVSEQSTTSEYVTITPSKSINYFEIEFLGSPSSLNITLIGRNKW